MNSFIDKSKKRLKGELLNEIRSGNTQKVKNILDYANKNKIILELNEKNKYRWYPLLDATYFDNIEMIQLLKDYANKNKIILK